MTNLVTETCFVVQLSFLYALQRGTNRRQKPKQQLNILRVGLQILYTELK